MASKFNSIATRKQAGYTGKIPANVGYSSPGKGHTAKTLTRKQAANIKAIETGQAIVRNGKVTYL